MSFDARELMQLHAALLRFSTSPHKTPEHTPQHAPLQSDSAEYSPEAVGEGVESQHLWHTPAASPAVGSNLTRKMDEEGSSSPPVFQELSSENSLVSATSGTCLIMID